MIEVNLIPDVKLELLKARKVRTNVISLSILITIVTAGAVALLAFYVFVVQTVAGALADTAIKNESAKLKSVDDLAQTLTIQNQMDNITQMHDKKNLTSRIFDILKTIVPEGKNTVAISSVKLDTEEGTITLEAEASNGYEALEVFKKTIAETTFSYSEGGDIQNPINIATEISDGQRRYAEDSDGNRVLRFTLSFAYAEELFLPTSERGQINAPDKQNATDSATGVPKSLFTNPSEDGSNQ
ncbi:TPA: hypothetical protein DIV49_03480 [Candidatus Saccharibacteria bacterium]|nr:hypothetical protein [Candidatus Saccharibacteria bacterium]HRJ90628.1 hypothetical protein [Candidatus Saccharibacteria bacterium]